MLSIKSQPGERSTLPPKSGLQKEKINKMIIENKNEFELRGDHTTKRKALNPSYSQTTFSVNNNFYGARLNPSDHVES